MPTKWFKAWFGPRKWRLPRIVKIAWSMLGIGRINNNQLHPCKLVNTLYCTVITTRT